VFAVKLHDAKAGNAAKNASPSPENISAMPKQAGNSSAPPLWMVLCDAFAGPLPTWREGGISARLGRSLANVAQWIVVAVCFHVIHRNARTTK
jgi:hypothetical protein